MAMLLMELLSAVTVLWAVVSACNALTIMFWFESLSGCNDESAVLLVSVSWCKRWSLHTCPPSFAGKLKTMRREVCTRFLRITDEQHELLGSQRDKPFTLHLKSSSFMKYNSPVRTVSLSSSCALRWASAPADDTSSETQLVRNSFTRL